MPARAGRAPARREARGRREVFDSITWTRDTGDPTAAPSCPRADGRRVRADRGDARAAARTTSSWPSSRCSGRSIAATSTRASSCAACPRNGPRVLQGPGENAGVIDVGDGLAVAFKVESHNHPSAVEPYQGAATGVGGILRDIFAMGARPIALGDSLRLGPLDEERPRELFRGIVRGIGGYGNCVGVPNVAGETVFDAAYRHNPLVNALCIGLLRADELVRASAAGPGNLVVLFGATTGRDGIGGASVLASQDLDEDDADKRPSVQVGDPFTGKKLIECTLELAARRPRRLGAGSRRSGPRLLDLRDGGERRRRHRAGARPRAAARAGHAAVRDHDLGVAGAHGGDRRARAPGRGRGRLRALAAPVHGRSARSPTTAACAAATTASVVGDMPAEALADAPRYPLHAERPDGLVRAARSSADRRAAGRPIRGALLLRAAGRAQHLRQDLGLRAVRPGRRLGHRRPPGRRRRRRAPDAVASARSPSRWTATARASRSTRAAAAPRPSRRRCSTSPAAAREPAAITNCLNFGNPERPGTAYALREAITGMAEACEVLGTPVVSGNVSLYNESGGRPIHPTPVVGCVGVLERADAAVPAAPADASGALFALGTAAPAYDGSEWQALVAGACCRPHPRGRPARAALALRPARRARPRAACSPRPTTSPTAASPSRWPRSRSPRGSGLEAAIEPGDDAAATALRRVLRPRRRELRARGRGIPGQGLRRCRGATRENRLPGRRRRSRCAAASSRSTSPLDDARAAYEGALPRAMAAG